MYTHTSIGAESQFIGRESVNQLLITFETSLVLVHRVRHVDQFDEA